MKTDGPLDPAALVRVTSVQPPSLVKENEDGLEKLVVPLLKGFNAQLEEVDLQDEAEAALRRRVNPDQDGGSQLLDRADLSEEGLLLGRVVDRIHPRQVVQLHLFSTELGLLGEAQENSQEGGLHSEATKRHPLMEALGLRGTDGADIASRVGLLASQIAQAIEKSGLFYESHLRQWKEGKRSKADLLDEPQSDWGPDSVLGKEGAVSVGADSLKASTLANQQLNLLINPRLLLMMPGLQGESIQVVLQREDPEGQGKSNEKDEGAAPVSQPAIWSFDMCLSLAKLGQIQAKLQIETPSRTFADKGLERTNTSLRLQVEAHNLDLFRLHGNEIRETLKLTSLSIIPLPNETP